MITPIVSRNLSWIDAGFSFFEILKIQDEIIDDNPFRYAGTIEIEKREGCKINCIRFFFFNDITVQYFTSNEG
jgi:hypothetical protein